MRVSERDKKIFKVLSEPVFQIGMNITDLCKYFSAEGCPNNSELSLKNSLYRRLKQLTQEAILEYHKPPPEGVNVYYLNRSKISIYGNIPSLRNIPKNMKFVLHERMTSKLALTIYIEEKKRHPDYSFSSLINHSLELSRYFPDSKIKDLIPDATVVISPSKKCHSTTPIIYFLEIDNSNEGKLVYESKISRYSVLFDHRKLDPHSCKILFLTPSLTRNKLLLKYFSNYVEEIQKAGGKKYADILQKAVCVTDLDNIENGKAHQWNGVSGAIELWK